MKRVGDGTLIIPPDNSSAELRVRFFGTGIRARIRRYRERRAIRLAIRGLALLDQALLSAHLPRPVRRRLMRGLVSGTTDVKALLKGVIDV